MPYSPPLCDQDLVLDHRRGHRFAIALLGVGDLFFPDQLAGERVERDQLGVERAMNSLPPEIATPLLFGPQQNSSPAHPVLVVQNSFPVRRRPRRHGCTRW